jgi:hypothetical protein
MKPTETLVYDSENVRVTFVNKLCKGVMGVYYILHKSTGKLAKHAGETAHMSTARIVDSLDFGASITIYDFEKNR